MSNEKRMFDRIREIGRNIQYRDYEKKVADLMQSTGPGIIPPASSNNPFEMTDEEVNRIMSTDPAKPGNSMTAISIRMAQESQLNTQEHFRLPNNKLRELFSDGEFWVNAKDAVAAFTYWVFKQNPDLFRDDDLLMSMKVHAAIKAFRNYIEGKIKDHMPIPYRELEHYIHAIEFERIPEILALNQIRPEFIDLDALARNVFYMIIRESITQG